MTSWLGDLATWIGSIATTASILYAAAQVRSGNRRAIEAQARSVHVVVDTTRLQQASQLDEVLCTATLQNRSDAPIYEVVVISHTKEHGGRMIVGAADFIEAGGRFAPPAETLPVDDDGRVVCSASFRDALGYRWQRLSTGALRPPVNMKQGNWLARLTAKRLPSLYRRWIYRANRPPLRTMN